MDKPTLGLIRNGSSVERRKPKPTLQLQEVLIPIIAEKMHVSIEEVKACGLAKVLEKLQYEYDVQTQEAIATAVALHQEELNQVHRERNILARITEDRMKSEAQARKAVLMDPKTGLQNQMGFQEHARNCIAFENRAPYVAIATADLVGFKTVDDTFGHLPGDKVLLVVAKCLSKIIRSAGDFVSIIRYDHESKTSVDVHNAASRYGGDEFAFLLLQNRPEGQKVALRAKQALRNINWHKGRLVKGIDLDDNLRNFLTAHPLDVRVGVVNFLLPEIDQRPKTKEAGDKLVRTLFERADAQLMVPHKKDPANPIHSVTVGLRDGELTDLSEVERTVL